MQGAQQEACHAALARKLQGSKKRAAALAQNLQASKNRAMKAKEPPGAKGRVGRGHGATLREIRRFDSGKNWENSPDRRKEKK